MYHFARFSTFILTCAFIVSADVVSGQTSRAEEIFDSTYAVRIEMEEINGVYIPKDLEDAFIELERLSSEEDIAKFKSAPEDLVKEKLHFGLGRWMIVNWGFYEGSRLSHLLRELGLEHPDDMAKFMMVSWHRHLKDLPLDVEDQVSYYKQQRELERIGRDSSRELIHSETRIRKKEDH